MNCLWKNKPFRLGGLFIAFLLAASVGSGCAMNLQKKLGQTKQALTALKVRLTSLMGSLGKLREELGKRAKAGREGRRALQAMKFSSIWDDDNSKKTLTFDEKVNCFKQDCMHLEGENERIPKHAKNDKIVRIASYNVHFWQSTILEPLESLHSLLSPRMLAVIKKINPDIIILQEVSKLKGLMKDGGLGHELFKNLGYLYMATIEVSHIHWGFGNVILSKYNFEGNPSGKIFDKMTPKEEERGYTNAVIALPNNKKISVYGTHLDVYDESGAVRNKQIHQLLNVINKDCADNILIAGDFNETRGLMDYPEKIWKRIKHDNWNRLKGKYTKKSDGAEYTEDDLTALGVSNVLGKAGFVDCFSHGNFVGPKFTVWSGIIVDFIYLNKSWSLPVAGCYTYFDAASDHLPIVMDVNVGD